MDPSTRLLTHICEQWDIAGHPSTIPELARTFHCSPATIHHLIRGLITRGDLEQAGPTKTLLPTHQGLIRAGRI